MSYIKISISLLALAVIVKAQKSTGYDHLDSALHHYDTLHTDHIEHSYTTSSAPYRHHRHITFNALGRNFHLSLVHNERIFSSDFGAHIAVKDGQLRQVPLDKKEFYHGYLHGDNLSSVTAHISKSGVLTASIITASEVYHIEPSHHYIKEPHPFHMIAYKSSHVKDRLSGSRMDYVTGPTVPPREDHLESKEAREKTNFHSSSHFEAEHGQNRLKRQTLAGGIGGLVCPMILVADFKVFNNFGGNERGIMVQLVQLVDSIDKIIYRPTRWIVDTSGRTVEGLGLEIRNITVHNTSSDSSDLHTLYNRDNPSADAGDLLGDMRFGDWSGYCLAHLFTDRDFATGLLGLANIASPFAGQTGGICSRAFRDFGFDPPREVIYNTGLTTFNNNGQQMLMSELIRVTGHELGHSWGSHHDPSGDPNCRDRWLMNEFAQDGSQATHMEFSGCSRTSIGQVLLSKATCFADPEICGNFEVNDGEQCDAGPEGDACCDSQCMLIGQCSDVNHPCCSNCFIASDNVTCRQVGRISINCTASTLCNGEDETCPAESPPAPEGTPCIGSNGGGTCQLNDTSERTECLSVCEMEAQDPCTCPQPNECVVCCKPRVSDGTGVCSPALNGTLPLSNGVICRQGDRVCVDGQCTDTTQDLIERIWDIIVNLDINAFGRFVGENIVGFTLIFSIPIWCIGSCLIHCFIDDGWRWFSSLVDKKVIEETDADLWFENRVHHYRKWISRKLDDAHIPLLSDREAETGGDDLTASEEKLLVPVDPVDDSPAPTYI